MSLLWGSIKTFPKRSPFVFGSVLAMVKTGGVDYLIQRYKEKRETIDYRRTVTFSLFGFLFLGCWQYGLFVKIMPRLCRGTEAFIAKPWREKLKDRQGVKNVLIQNFLENGVNNPLLYFPCFYMIQEYLNDGVILDGIKKYQQNWKQDVPDILKVWVPAQLINFAFSPLWLRVPFVTAVSVLWTGIVSATRGEYKVVDAVPATEAAAARTTAPLEDDEQQP